MLLVTPGSQEGGLVHFLRREQDGGLDHHRARGVGGNRKGAGVDMVGEVNDHKDICLAEGIKEGFDCSAQGVNNNSIKRSSLQ